jgi:hypothetical protein
MALMLVSPLEFASELTERGVLVAMDWRPLPCQCRECWRNSRR